MDNKVDYSQYSYTDLISARSGIDAQAYPERTAQLDKLIQEHQRKSTVDSAQKSQTLRTSNVIFHGKAGEFFSIWIVNLLLTIVTLGIYSAWATVRTNRYFYSNTEIDGHRFMYLAEPLQILKGRLIGIGLFVLYFLLSSFSPLLAGIIIIVIALATPYLVCLSMRFRMRMSGYRNVRFNFKGNVGEAFTVFLFLPIVALFTLYLALPWTLKKMDEYIYGNITFGDREFKTDLKTSNYYIAALGSVAITILIFFAAGTIFGLSFDALIPNEGEAKPEFSLAYLAIFAAYIFVFLLASSFYEAYIRNHIFNNTEVDNVATFNSQVSVAGLIWLRISNFAAILLTIGFAMPWTKIRNARFYAQATQVDILQGADEVIADDNANASAVGDEVANAFDIELAL